MIIGGGGFIDQVSTFRVVLFRGRFGSGKTLMAVVTARELLRMGVVQRIYANMPMVGASSPPEGIGLWDFTADYAKDAVYVVDEAWAGFMEFSPDRLRSTFAFVRHQNQVFLMASVLPLQAVRRYCFLFCERYYNFGVFGLPWLWYHFYLSVSGRGALYGDKAQSFHVLFPGRYFGLFDTRYNPVSIFPIQQEEEGG